MKKEVVLKRIRLSNWRSLNLDVSFNEKETSISASNGLGKTSLQTGWNWLLSGYTTADEPKNHNLFDNQSELTPETPIASVKAWISINGIEYTLEKTAQAKFSRKRGTSEYTKDSADVYKMFVDDIEMSATAYAEWIDANICPIDKLEYCLDGLFFVNLAHEDKKKARAILETMVGEIKREEFKGNYDAIDEGFAKGYSVEQIEESARHKLKSNKEDQTRLPILIADKEKDLAELESIDFSSIEKELEEKQLAIKNIDEAILSKSDSPLVKERNELIKLIDEKQRLLSGKENEWDSKLNDKRNEIRNEISRKKALNTQIITDNANLQSDWEFSKKRLTEEKAVLEGYEKEIDVLRVRRDEIKSMVFTENHCSVCGQELPLDMLEKAKENFLKHKQDLFDAVVSQGRALASKIKTWEELVSNLQAKVDKGIVLQEEISTSDLEKELRALNQECWNYKNTTEYKEFSQEIDELKEKLPTITNDNSNLITMKETLLQEIKSLSKELAKKETKENLIATINEFKETYRKVGIVGAVLEGIVDKCKEWIEERANIVSLRIADKLKGCKIRMWEKQKNGELAPSCSVLDKKGVKYLTTNGAEKIKICLSLQQMFCEQANVVLPIWVDEASVFSIENRPTFKTQTIYMFASSDKTLKIT